MFIDFTVSVFLSYVCNIVDMLKRFKLNFHLDGRFTSTHPITYVGEELTYVGHYHEDPDYMCEFDIYKLLSEIGYEKPNRMEFSSMNVRIGSGGKMCQNSTDFVSMINLTWSEGRVELHVEAEKLKENVGGKERVGVQTQFESEIQQKIIETNQPSDEIKPIRNETQAKTQPQTEPETQPQTHETQPETNENQPETNDSDGDDEYIPIDEHETDVSDGEDSTLDKELLEARRCSKRLRNKFGSRFPTQDNSEVKFPSISTLFNVYNPQTTEEGYESAYERSEEEQDSLVPSDVDYIFLYKEHKKKMRLIEYDPSCEHKQLEFFIGMKFTRPQQFREVVQMYAVENGRKIRWKVMH